MTGCARFLVTAQAEPQTLPRILNHIAQLGLCPAHVRADVVDGRVEVVIEQRGLTGRQADVVAERMRASVLIEAVRLEARPLVGS